MSAIDLIQLDITQLDVDAIINAAKSTLAGGGGVDGAIHRAAGPLLLAECLLLGGCKAGEAKITGGYNLKARYVIHTVGPVWQGGNQNEKAILAACYLNCLTLAVDNHCSSLAFPNISTGVYGFPKELAADIALREVKSFLRTNKTISRVLFCCYDSINYSIYKRLI